MFSASDLISLAKSGEDSGLQELKESLKEERDDIVLEAAFVDYREADGQRILHHLAAHASFAWFSFVLELADELDRQEELIESETSNKKTISHFIVCLLLFGCPINLTMLYRFKIKMNKLQLACSVF